MTNEKPGGHGDRAHAAGGLDMAVWDAVAKIAGKPLWKLLAERFNGGQADETILVYPGGGYYYPGKELEGLRAEMRGYQDQGYSVVKMKIGGADLATDLKRIEAVHRSGRQGRERRRRRQRAFRSRHGAGLRQGHAALRTVLVRGAGRSAGFPAQRGAGGKLCRRAGDGREPVLDHRWQEPAALRRHAARSRLGAARPGAELRPDRVPAFRGSRGGHGLVAAAAHSARRTSARRSTSRPVCRRAARRAIPVCSNPMAGLRTHSDRGWIRALHDTPGIGMELCGPAQAAGVCGRPGESPKADEACEALKMCLPRCAPSMAHSSPQGEAYD